MKIRNGVSGAPLWIVRQGIAHHPVRAPGDRAPPVSCARGSRTRGSRTIQTVRQVVCAPPYFRSDNFFPLKM